MIEATDPSKGSMAGGLIAGLMFATPFAVLLSFVGLLVFYLGLFFFMIFGLLIGALMYRMWAPLRPLSRQRMLVGTAIVTLYAWGSALYLEGHWISINVSKAAMGQVRSLPTGMDDGQAKAIFQEDARRFLIQRGRLRVEPHVGVEDRLAHGARFLYSECWGNPGERIRGLRAPLKSSGVGSVPPDGIVCEGGPARQPLLEAGVRDRVSGVIEEIDAVLLELLDFVDHPLMPFETIRQVVE